MIFKPKEEVKYAFKKYYSRGQRTYAERVRRRIFVRRLLMSFMFILVFLLGFFIMSLLLDISSLPPV